MAKVSGALNEKNMKKAPTGAFFMFIASRYWCPHYAWFMYSQRGHTVLMHRDVGRSHPGPCGRSAYKSLDNEAGVHPTMMRYGGCATIGMSTDKHYNEEGKLPGPLEDHEPTDMPATLGIFVMIAIVAAIAVAALALFHYIW